LNWGNLNKNETLGRKRLLSRSGDWPESLGWVLFPYEYNTTVKNGTAPPVVTGVVTVIVIAVVIVMAVVIND
jgi:hypothetical protein